MHLTSPLTIFFHYYISYIDTHVYYIKSLQVYRNQALTLIVKLEALKLSPEIDVGPSRH